MREFLGQNGNTFYIINQDFNEAASFDTYGKELSSDMSATLAASSCLRVEPIDVLSLLGTSGIVVGSEYTEIYFDGYSAPIDMQYLQVFAKLRGSVRSIGGRYYFRNSDGYSQVILTLTKNSVSKELIESLIGKKLKWSKLGN